MFPFFRTLRLALGFEEKITVREIIDNPGLIPFNLGNAKVQKFTHTIIHYYDLNPILSELEKLHIKSKNLTETVNKHSEYSFDVSNYIKILKLTQDRVDTKIREIIPGPSRMKRGLINGFGSFFKSITGNLDAYDGERYDRIISELQNNQNKVNSNILKENSISLSIIKRFNATVQQISVNEKLLESKLNQVGLIIQKTTYRENSIFIKDILNQIINVYEIIDSILQDIENSIAFSKLKIMHSSIIKTEDLYSELLNVQKIIGSNQMPLEVTLENILFYEKLIKVDCFAFKNKVTYLLRIPITYPTYFKFLHLYSIPVLRMSQFKVIIPRNNFLLINELHYAFRNRRCTEVKAQFHVCDQMDLKEISDSSPCTVKLLQNAKDTSTCHQIEMKITRSTIKQLDVSDQWVLILPKEEVVKFKCNSQEESQRLVGTYLLKVPHNCKVMSSQESIINNRVSVSNFSEPILFPDIDNEIRLLPTLNLSMRLQDIKLDGLHELQNLIEENQPPKSFISTSGSPSIWTITLYAAIIIAAAWYAYKKKCFFKPKGDIPEKPREIELKDVQLPR